MNEDYMNKSLMYKKLYNKYYNYICDIFNKVINDAELYGNGEYSGSFLLKNNCVAFDGALAAISKYYDDGYTLMSPDMNYFVSPVLYGYHEEKQLEEWPDEINLFSIYKRDPLGSNEYILFWEGRSDLY